MTEGSYRPVKELPVPPATAPSRNWRGIGGLKGVPRSRGRGWGNRNARSGYEREVWLARCAGLLRAWSETWRQLAPELEIHSPQT